MIDNMKYDLKDFKTFLEKDKYDVINHELRTVFSKVFLLAESSFLNLQQEQKEQYLNQNDEYIKEFNELMSKLFAVKED